MQKKDHVMFGLALLYVNSRLTPRHRYSLVSDEEKLNLCPFSDHVLVVINLIQVPRLYTYAPSRVQLLVENLSSQMATNIE